MHLLNAAQPARDDAVAVDLGQTPGAIAVLSAADSDLACLAAARRRLPDDFPAVRLANLLRLGHPYSIDLQIDRVLARAELVIVRLLGGAGYWRYGVDRLAALGRRGVRIALLPGDERPDPELADASTVAPEALARLWRYGLEGGVDNAEQCLRYAAELIGRPGWAWAEPAPLPRAGELPQPPAEGSEVPILFYRALLQSGNLEPVEALAAALRARGLAPRPVYVHSLKDPPARALLERLVAARPAAIVAATGFTVGDPTHPLANPGCAVLQVVFSGGDQAEWAAGSRGLDPRDIAMNVALPELDGRILTRAVAFKRAHARDPLCEIELATLAPEPSRIAAAAEIAAGWARLAATPAAGRRVLLVLANYPNRDGRIGNGVGLDTPASAAAILAAMAAAGYAIPDRPADGTALMARLTAGPTNDLAARATRSGGIRWPVADYRRALAGLPAAVQAAVVARWGEPEADPHVDDGAFRLAGFVTGTVAVMIQPARGYNIDPAGSYHDPALVPPHGYLAAYLWARRSFDAHAVVHVGKHGTLEWLPGKSLALGEECWPEAVGGLLPNLYPFIVNDPGEGTQAKRRTQAVVVDHLTPPLTRAETYGPLAELEQLVDEYVSAAGLDPRRLPHLGAEILDRVDRAGLAADCGIAADEPLERKLTKLDGFLCEVKELQIRDGLHVFGTSPTGDLAADLLVALARSGDGITRALAADLELGFDPLTADLATPWSGPRPAALAGASAWRIAGDTVERLEQLAQALVAGRRSVDPAWARTKSVLERVDRVLRPAVAACGPAEISGLLAGLDGHFVPPGPSGAPTRGRTDVLPTGRNFYSVDTRAVPTPAAWALGWRSAQELVERHLQETGRPLTAIALTSWGTSTMRTGGDDVAQALALMGVQPTWDPGSHRLTGFQIMPAGLLDRPRVDVTLRVSGFFRDAFPGLIDLVDRAARAVAALDEPASVNPLAAAVGATRARLEAEGVDPATALRRAGTRVFGSKPGSYGAGLQALIDEGGWRDAGDLAAAYIAWGGYAYGSDGDGGALDRGFAGAELEDRLGRVDAVVHNQDNREHDLLDSDDYYQFEGGLAAAVARVQGAPVPVWHADHSVPERPRIRSLAGEIARVVRGRAANPKWLAGVRRHGYKGAAEMAATVDYLFAFAATTGAVAPAHFEALFRAYLDDPVSRAFLAEHNPAALKEITARFAEAIERGLWLPAANDVRSILAQEDA